MAAATAATNATKVMKNMGSSSNKKCLGNSGICLPNMAWFILGMLFVAVAFLYFKLFGSSSSVSSKQENAIHHGIRDYSSMEKPDISDPYLPPLKNPPVNQLPPPIVSTAKDPSYQQIGILTKETGSEPTILPLMGRALSSARDKWQYYTMTNGAGINSRLPVNSNGKACTGEYGCDGIYNGDSLFVDGYNDTFKAVVYETGGYEYRPL
jgi:hypothetical protein